MIQIGRYAWFPVDQRQEFRMLIGRHLETMAVEEHQFLFRGIQLVANKLSGLEGGVRAIADILVDEAADDILHDALREKPVLVGILDAEGGNAVGSPSGFTEPANAAAELLSTRGGAPCTSGKETT